jgi:predicted metal-binding membrane protein
MGRIPMPGGWAMAAMWLPMCGQSRLGALAGFIGMWAAMMVPMMLPLAVTPLRRYRAALAGTGPWRACLLTAAAACAWAAAWTVPALPLYVAGTIVAQALLDLPALARIVPVLAAAAGVAGAGWHAVSWCRRPAHVLEAACGRPAVAAALRQGARLGSHCVRRCAGMTVAMVAAGFMETGTMAVALAVVLVESVRLRERQAVQHVARHAAG